ncbi:MAG: amidase [Betaproteobacteria bacterium]|nr:MAG: amidase [Betaproteobacteria bacterium]
MKSALLQSAKIIDLAAALRTGDVTPVSLAEAFLARIEALNARLHAFITVTAERALAEARVAEAQLRAGLDLGYLHGIPYAVKDLFNVKGLATTAGTRLLANNVAERDCAAVRKLAMAGMTLVGKTHTVQFAFGGIGINHDQGTPRNPWSSMHMAPGGSSSGSAVAVGADLTPVALGTDTGGSVRVPAALCGTVGLKTTVGRISRAGVYPLSWTFDSVGPLTRCVEDAAIVYQALRGIDPGDDTTVSVPPDDDVLATLKAGVKGIRLAFGETVFFDDVDAEIEHAVREAGAVLRALGAHVHSMAVPEVAEIMSDKRRSQLIAAEALVTNGRLIDEHFDSLDPVVAHRMRAGRDLSATDYFAALRQCSALRERVKRTLADVDALLVPATLIPSRPIEQIDASPQSYADTSYRYARNTSIGNVLGLCAVVLPCGFTRSGLPVGLMIYAKPFAEAVALRVAWAYEQATSWQHRRPDLS